MPDAPGGETVTVPRAGGDRRPRGPAALCPAAAPGRRTRAPPIAAAVADCGPSSWRWPSWSSGWSAAGAVWYEGQVDEGPAGPAVIVDVPDRFVGVGRDGHPGAPAGGGERAWPSGSSWPCTARRRCRRAATSSDAARASAPCAMPSGRRPRRVRRDGDRRGRPWRRWPPTVADEVPALSAAVVPRPPSRRGRAARRGRRPGRTTSTASWGRGPTSWCRGRPSPNSSGR